MCIAELATSSFYRGNGTYKLTWSSPCMGTRLVVAWPKGSRRWKLTHHQIRHVVASRRPQRVLMATRSFALPINPQRTPRCWTTEGGCGVLDEMLTNIDDCAEGITRYSSTSNPVSDATQAYGACVRSLYACGKTRPNLLYLSQSYALTSPSHSHDDSSPARHLRTPSLVSSVVPYTTHCSRR